MPAASSCPVPEIDRALSSYINSKQETIKIRETLSKYLVATVRRTNASGFQHLDYECPHEFSAVKSNTPALKLSRLSYLDALQANIQARERHRELQASLDELQVRHLTETSGHNELDYDNEATRGYVSLLRQRCRYSELQVIQDSLEKLLGANPVNSHKDLKERVTENVGEQPGLPAERLEQLSSGQDGDSAIFKLKKEVIEAKALMEKTQAIRADAQSNPRKIPSLAQQVYALSCARDETVEWVEGELAKMNEESILLEDASPVKQWPKDTTALETGASEEHIYESYNRYMASRLKLIKNYDSIQRSIIPEQDASHSSSDAVTTTHGSVSTTSSGSVANVVPYLSHLTRTSNNERSLLQQAVHLQAQLKAADEDITESLARLGEESHLLPSGSRDIMAWRNTASQAEKATEEFVSEQLQESHHEVNSVHAIVDLCSLQSEVLTST